MIDLLLILILIHSISQSFNDGAAAAGDAAGAAGAAAGWMFQVRDRLKDRPALPVSSAP